MPKIEVTSDAPAIAADRRYLPNVTDIMWNAVAGASARSLPPPGPAADLRHVQRGLAHRLGALAQVMQMLLHPEQVRVRQSWAGETHDRAPRGRRLACRADRHPAAGARPPPRSRGAGISVGSPGPGRLTSPATAP